MGRRHEDMRDEIFFARRHAGAAFAAAALHTIIGQRRALDIAGMRDRNGDVFAFDEVFVFDFDFRFDEFRQPRRGEFVFDVVQFVADDRKHTAAAAQDVEIIGDRFAQLLYFVADFVAAQRRQPRQANFEDCLGLFFGQTDRVAFQHHVARIGNQSDERRHIARGPDLFHQLRLAPWPYLVPHE